MIIITTWSCSLHYAKHMENGSTAQRCCESAARHAWGDRDNPCTAHNIPPCQLESMGATHAKPGPTIRRGENYYGSDRFYVGPFLGSNMCPTWSKAHGACYATLSCRRPQKHLSHQFSSHICPVSHLSSHTKRDPRCPAKDKNWQLLELVMVEFRD